MNESANLNLGIKFFSWCLVILVVSVLVLTFRLLGPFELRYVDLAPPRLSQIDSPVRVLALISTEDSPATYFRYVLEIVGRLKKVGVRVVVVPIPPATQYVPEIQTLLRKIAAYDNVVFGDQLKSASPYQDLTDKELDNPENWWTSHPMNHLVPMFWGVSSVRVSRMSSLLRIVPNQYRESMKGYFVPDVALQTVKKFAGYPDSAVIAHHFGTVSMGSYRIPVWEDGFAYLKTSTMLHFAPFYAYVGPATDSVRYGGQWSHGKELPVTDSTWEAMAGKIVIINWPHLSSRINWRLIGYAGAYEQVINAILTNTFVHRYDQWNLAVVFLAVVLAGALLFAVRTWLAVVLLLVSILIVLFVSLWLFRAHDIIFDPVYLLFTIALCVTILPVAKVSHEKEYYRKQLIESKEEIAGLEEQLRKSSSPQSTINR